MRDCVFDASVVIARLRNETGAEVAEARAPSAVMSAVNQAEVITRLVDMGVEPTAAATAVSMLGIEIIPFDGAMAIRAGLLRAETRRRGLSLGDRACLALAEAMGLPALTADRAWAELDLGVQVVLIR